MPMAPHSPRVPAFDQASWRKQIPILSSHVIMNVCSHAPQSLATRAAADAYLDGWNAKGMDWDAWMQSVQDARSAFARLVNAAPEDIAVFSSVSEATSAVASALDFSGTRRTVLATEAEFPTVGHAWLAQQRRGARVAWVPERNGVIDPADIASRISEETVVVSACHGYYVNGALQELPSLTRAVHEQGALLYVDAYQTAGAVPIDVRASGVDFLAAGCLKYLMGVPGIAFLYVKPSLLPSLEPLLTGWFGRANPFAFAVKQLDWSATASRFDTGTPPILNACIARAGIDMVNTVGVERIRGWHEVLSERLIDGGRARGLTVHGAGDSGCKTASTAFVTPQARDVEIALRKRGVLASARGPVIRLAPHFFSTLDDVDLALDALAAVTTGAAPCP